VRQLPDPVRRYFAFALPEGHPFVRGARVEQEGELLMPGGDWRRFSAVSHVVVQPPGFVWDATIRMAGVVPVRIRDSYLQGEGAMRGRLAGLVPVAEAAGSPEMAAASLQRYLAEAPWVPTALLPNAGVAWTAIDDSSARATLTDHGTTVWVDFQFGAEGEIVGIRTDRYRALNGRQVLTPWVGRFWDYARVNGVMVPRSGEVAWAPAEGTMPYWRGRITAVLPGGLE
jgi:hypothetical protein